MKKQLLFLLFAMFVTNISFAQFASVTNLTAIATTTNTGEKPQSKTWQYGGTHWCVLANLTGTHLWRLDGTTWTKTLTLASNTYAKPDCKVVGAVTHVLVYNKNKSYLYSLEYDPATNNYVPWSKRKTKVDLALDAGVQTATIDIDGTGRMWLASDGTTTLNIRYSDVPYSTWSGPISLATNVTDEDICAVVAMPTAGKMGFFWSNGTTKRFGFETHVDGSDPAIWSSDEQPGSASAQNVGGGFADNHVNIKATTDGRIYCAIKTNYNTANYTQIGLLVRQPDGTWDPIPYPVTIKSGTRPIVIVDESSGKLKVVYTAADGGGNIVYKETFTTSISFGPENLLIGGLYDNSTSTKGSYNNEVVILASNSTQAVSVLAKDAASPSGDKTAPTVTGITRQNPLNQNTNLTSVTYRVVFSESVTGVNAADFSLTAVTGTVSGTVGTVTAVATGTAGSTYDVPVTGISGNGDLRLDLKASATGIADAAGNPIVAGFTSGEVYSVNQTAPTLSSVTIASNNATPSLAKTGDVVTVSFTASQTINTPTVTIATHTATVAAGTSANSYKATYTMAAADASGVVPFTINFSSTTGTAGTQVTTTTDGSSVTFDKTAPTVTGITRQNPLNQNTNLTSVTYRVVFSESVTGVNAADFSLTAVTGTVSGTVGTVTAVATGTAGSTYDVPVTGISGNGDLRLDLKASATGIADAAGNPIVAGFTSGEVYSVNQTAPTLSSVTIASNNATPSLAKTGDVVTVSFTASQTINTPTVTIATHTATVAAGTSANSYKATYTMAAADASGVVPFTINFSSTTGTAGTQVTTTTDGSSVTFDKTAPTVTGITRQNPLNQNTNLTSVTYRVVFSESVTGVNAADFSLTAVTGTVSGTVGTVTAVATGTAGSTYDVPVTGISGNGDLRLDLKASATGIADAAGNPIVAGFTSGEVYSVNQTAPTLTSVTIASNNATPSLAKTGDVVTVSFTASQTINTPTVTIATHTATVAAGTSANSYKATYTMAAADASGVVPFTINFSSTTGTAGTQVTTTTDGSSVTFDKTAPTVTGITRQNPLNQNTNLTSVTYRVVFSESVTGVNAADFSLTAVTGTVSGTVGTVTAVATGTAGSTYDVPVTGISGNGDLRLDLKASATGIADAAGNPIVAGFTSGEVYSVNQTAPTLTSVTIASNNATPSLAKTGDVVTVSFTASQTINTPTVTIATHTATVAAGTSANSYKATYTMAAADASGVVPFTINFSSTTGTAGTQVTTTTDGSSVTFDKTAPTVTGITRQNPLNQNTNLTSVTYRVVFSESVTGVNAADFSLTAVTGTVSGTVGTVTAVATGTAGSTYDVPVTGISGNGDLRLDLKASATGIADAAGNPIVAGFTSGEVYSVNQTAPTLSSVTIASNNATPSLAKTGDVVTVSFTASQTINTPTVTIATHTATVAAGTSANSYKATYTMAAADASGVVPFTINFSSTTGTAGTQVTTTTNSSSVTFDKTAPTVVSINRQSPSTQTAPAGPVTYRVTFSEAVNGVDPTDFTATRVTGTTASGTVQTVTAVASTNAYDVVVNASGTGDLRLDLKATGTSIVDAAGNPIAGGYTGGQVFSITAAPPVTLSGFKTVTYLAPLDISSHTGQKPQAKTWKYDNKWWAALPTSGGTYIFKLDNNTNSWTQTLKLASASNAKCDVRVVGDVVHILLFRGASNVSNFVSAQYDATSQSYKLWPTRTAAVNITFEAGTETATLDMDSKGILWIASDADTDVRVRWSASPYSSWSAPIILASGITTDDICSVTHLKDGKIGVFWGNQNTQRFGFRTHLDGTAPDAVNWSADENPASQSALSVGHGYSDDHLQLMLASDGTLYVAVKTSYDTPGYTKLGLMVRRPGSPNATWDDLYTVTTNAGPTDSTGTRPMVILNEAVGKLKVLYTGFEGGGSILYKEALISDLTKFGPEIKLFNGNYNYLTSTHQTYSPEIAVIVTDQSSTQLRAAGFLGSDVASSSSTSIASAPLTSSAVANGGLPEIGLKALFEVHPNPVPGLATVSFTIPETGNYTLAVHDLKGAQVSLIKQGWAEAGKLQTAAFDGSQLPNGIYLLRLLNNRSAKTIKLILMK